jgi:hypothetical protein
LKFTVASAFRRLGASFPMSYTVVHFQETPNPNALKCILDRPAADRPRSYFAAPEAAADPLAARLFAIDGVTNVLINADWVTVGKRPDAPWPRIRAAVQKVLREAE